MLIATTEHLNNGAIGSAARLSFGPRETDFVRGEPYAFVYFGIEQHTYVIGSLCPITSSFLLAWSSRYSRQASR
jgi:hypothetical protein